MKITVLDAATLGSDISLSPLYDIGETEAFETSNETETIERIKDCEVVVLNKVKLGVQNLKYAKKLKLICILATGYDNVDIDYCRNHGIAVCNVRGYSTDSVAQVTLSMALSLSTNLPQFDRFAKSGAYTKSGIQNCLTPTFHELAGKVWGIVGLGNIGKKVASVASAIGCSVIAYKRTPDPSFECVGLDDLCRRSDIISVHLPLSDETRGIISREKISKMKETAVFINVARGAVADEGALAEAIKCGRIGGLGIDVYSTEPFPEDHPYSSICSYDNVCFTPHMAWGAFEARERCLAEVVENIRSFYKNERRCRID